MDPTILTSVTDQTKQDVEETSRERDARAQQNFPQVEGLLPDLPRRRSVSRIDGLTSYLGHLNPFSHPVQQDTEIVWLFDNAAYRPEPFHTSQPQPWQVEIVSAYFVRSSGRDCSKEVAKIATILGLDKGTGVDKEKAMKTIEDRLIPLLNTILPARTVEVKIGDAQSKILGPSGPNGVSVDMVQIDKNYQHGDETISNTVPHLASSIPGRTRLPTQQAGQLSATLMTQSRRLLRTIPSVFFEPLSSRTPSLSQACQSSTSTCFNSSKNPHSGTSAPRPTPFTNSSANSETRITHPAP